MNIELVRFAYTVKGTFGIFMINGDALCYTVERPWLNNARNVSCIPEGEYPLRMRKSGVVARSSGGEFERGWEICDVPDRSYIMIHVANHMNHLEGCTGVGDKLGQISDLWGVWNSRATFRKLMGVLPEDEQHSILVAFDKEVDNENEVPDHAQHFNIDGGMHNDNSS